MEIELDLYNKLLKCAIFRASPKTRTIYDRKKVQLDADTIAIFENGVALSRYLVVLKDIFRKGNQDLNIDVSKMQQIKNQFTPSAKLFNWNLICTELDKLGISIDADIRSLIVAGDQEQIIQIFTRIERFLTKISGKQVNYDLYRADAQVQGGDNANEKTSNARRGNKPNQKKKIVKDGVDILTMNAEREIADTESSLELILNTLCKAFSMKPKQAAALLTNNNQFLIHSIVKGVKGRYEPLISWYQDLYANSRHLTNLLELEAEQFPNTTNFVKVLATLSCGMYSHNIEICKWCSKLLTKVGYDFGQNQAMFDSAMTWFLEKEGGLELSLHALKVHSDLTEDFVLFVQQFSSVNDQVEQVYKVEMKKYFASPLEYTNAINDLLPFMSAQCGEGIRRSGIIDFWVESCIRQADNDGKHSYDERIAALTLLAEIWLSFTDVIDGQKEEVANSILQMLKRGARDKHRPIRIVAVCALFRLLDKFSEDKNQAAPSIYKTLIFSLVESPNDSNIRYLYFSNFMSLYDTMPSIPIGLLIEPLVKQIQVTEGITYFFKIFDFDFFTFLAKHPKLSIQHAIPLVDLLAKVYLNEVVYASAARVPFVMICARFIQDEAMQEFVIKFETICLSMLMGLEKNAEELQQKHQLMLQARELALQKNPKKMLALPAPPVPPQKKVFGKKQSKEQRAQRAKEQEEDLGRRLKKSNIVEVSMKVQNLRNEEINDQLRDMYLSTNKRFNELYGYFNKGIMALLKWWGDPDQVMGAYIRAIEEREQKERDEIERKERMEQDRLRQIEEEKERQETEERERRQLEVTEKLRLMGGSSEAEDDRRLMLGYDSERQEGSKQQSVRNSMAVLPYTGKQAAPLRNFKALQQIEKIKRNKQQKEEQKRLEEERRRLHSARQKAALKQQLDKRKVELGVGSSTDQAALIYEGEDKPKGKTHLTSIRLLDLDEEEERDKETVNEFMKAYSKLWRNLFYKYANSGFSSKQINNFTQLEEKLSTLNSAEATKMLKDHNAFPLLINKDELQQLFRLINTKVFHHVKSDLQALDYPGFLAFIMQLAFFCFTRPPKDLSTLPPVETLRALVSHFETATRARGLNPVLYEDPDATGLGDKQLVKALNDKLASDPGYPIPEGFFKQIERVPKYEYRIPDSMYAQDEQGVITDGGVLSEAQVFGVEVLDSALNELFGVHILEPLVSFEEKLKVRPIIRNQFKPQAEALNYMRKVEKKIKPLDQQLNDKALLNADEKRKVNQEVKPALSIALKLEVAQYPLKERPQVQEVAEVLEEILQAAEKGLTSLPNRLNRAPGQLWNEIKQKKQEEQSKTAEIKNLKEDKRLKHDQFIKDHIKTIKEEKAVQMEETKQQRSEKEARDKEAQQKKEQEMRRKIEENKRKARETQQKNLEDIQAKKQEEEERNREANEKKKKERAEFLKKQKEKLAQEFESVYKEREDLELQKEDYQKKQKEFEGKIRGQMENYIKEHHEDRKKEEEERKQINELLHQHDVESVFGLYNNSLGYFFKFYAQQEKKDVGFTLEKSMNQMNFREFIRFGFQQNIVPALLPPETMVFIFRQLIRERIAETSANLEDNYLGDNNAAQVLDYEYFKKAIVRIAIMAQDYLGGQKEELFIEKLQEETRKKEEEQKKKENTRRKDTEKSKAEKEAKEQMRAEFQTKQKEILAKTQKSPQKEHKDLKDPDQEDLQDDQPKKKRTGSKKKKVEEVLEISIAKKANEDAFFDKWMKQREAKGISLKKRIIGNEKEGTKKITKKRRVKIEGEEDEGEEQSTNAKKRTKVVKGSAADAGAKTTGDDGGAGDMDEIREGEDIEGDDQQQYGSTGNYNTPGTITRKTKTANELKKLQEMTLQKEQLAGIVKIEDKHIKQDLNVQVVSSKTIEALLMFLGIEPDDHRYILDNKLNQHRIEIQGQKPTKIKKALKPNKLDNIKENAGHQKEAEVEEQQIEAANEDQTFNNNDGNQDGEEQQEQEQVVEDQQ